VVRHCITSWSNTWHASSSIFVNYFPNLMSVEKFLKFWRMIVFLFEKQFQLVPKAVYSCFFSLKHFGHFLSRHFGHFLLRHFGHFLLRHFGHFLLRHFGHFLLRHFGHFLLRHCGHWNISVVCLTVVSKLAVTVFISLYFQTFWPK